MNSPTIRLEFRTGANVITPKGVGYILILGNGEAHVRLPIPGQVDPACITPTASKDSLWSFNLFDLKRIPDETLLAS